MKKTNLIGLLFITIFSGSCHNNSISNTKDTEIAYSISGKTFYLLNVKDLAVQETQLNFKSDNTIDARFTLNAMPGDCFNYKNTPSILNESIKLQYKINGDILTIDKLNISIRTDQIDNQDLFYKTSIVEHLNDSVGYKRIVSHSLNKDLADMYMEMINNNSDSPIGEEELEYDPEGGAPRKTFKINSHKNSNNPYKLNPLGSSKTKIIDQTTANENAGIVHSLNDRTIIEKPTPDAEFREGGKVIVRVTVNREGQIINKRIKSSPSNELSKIAIEKTEGGRFSKSESTESEQYGDITFVFKSREQK